MSAALLSAAVSVLRGSALFTEDQPKYVPVMVPARVSQQSPWPWLERSRLSTAAGGVSLCARVGVQVLNNFYPCAPSLSLSRCASRCVSGDCKYQGASGGTDKAKVAHDDAVYGVYGMSDTLQNN